MTKHSIVIVNGPARAGKDSFVEACIRHLRARGILTSAFSSITPVVNLLMRAGIDTSRKTEADRKLLADVGAAVEEHSGFRTEHCMTVCRENRRKGGSHGSVTFLHVREPANILHLIYLAEAQNFDEVLTVKITGPRGIHSDNLADRAVDGFRYGAEITNDGNLDQLSDRAFGYLELKGLF